MAQTWVVIGIFGAFAVGVLAMMWSRMDRLDAKIDAQGTVLGTKIDDLSKEIHALAERQAEMNGEQRVLREMAHTHTAA